MIKLEHNKQYTGTLKSPSSKSYMQRAIVIALLAEGDTHITNPCFCNDVDAVLKIASDIGAHITRTDNEVIISPNSKLLNTELNVGESGLGIRMLTPVAALFSETITLTGEGSLKTRPMHIIEKPLRDLGVDITTNNGFLPIQVKGPLKGGQISIDGRLSSQILTGLLIALPKVNQSSVLEVVGLNSKPYIDMTLEIMTHFGAKITHEQYKKFHIKGGQHYNGMNYCIEGDWSGTAFHAVAGAISGDVLITDINPNSKQADVRILDALALAGAEVIINNNSIRVKKNQLKAFEFDATHCPDLFPPLSNLAVACEGVSVIKGVSRLLHKESDRGEALQKEWKSLGIEIQIIGDEMHIKGGEITGGVVDSHNDHRIAMMGAVASLNASSPIHITGHESVGKSYPSFFEDFKTLKQ